MYAILHELAHNFGHVKNLDKTFEEPPPGRATGSWWAHIIPVPLLDKFDPTSNPNLMPHDLANQVATLAARRLVEETRATETRSL